VSTNLIIKRPGNLNAVQVIDSSIMPDHNATVFWSAAFGVVVPPIVKISKQDFFLNALVM
jgi:hypothetical protein